MQLKVEDKRVTATVPLITPKQLKQLFPLKEAHALYVHESRETIENILERRDKRLIAIVGPCSIHKVDEAMEYARKLAALRQKFEQTMFVVMRVYFEKPRTTTGWKGLINDPHLDGSHDIDKGLRLARGLLLDMADLGLPAATEFLDPIVPQYTADLVSWAAIGARTTESQTHREMASGLSMPVGFKNSTDGAVEIAVNAMLAARNPHQFLGIDADGVTSVIKTSGNAYGHVVMRGGRLGANYDPDSLERALRKLRAHGLPPNIMVDCSHGNSEKRAIKQPHVLKEVIAQKLKSNQNIIGFMLESNLLEGRQPHPVDRTELQYGLSITDECISFDQTERCLLETHDRLIALT